MKSIELLDLARVTLVMGSVALLTSTATAAERESTVLTDFSDDAVVSEWVSINDNVMGGISKGGFALTDSKTLLFSGSLSLENNGGFTSIRSRPADLGLAGYDTIAVRLKGDGRTYSLDLRTRSTRMASSYRSTFKTRDGVWEEIRIPLKDFEYTSFGRRIPGRSAIQAADINAVGFTLSEKRPGRYDLELDWIKAEGGAPAVADVAAKGSRDLVATAAAAGQFKTLIAAAKAAGLVDGLQAEGTITVFAPNDAAFAKLPEGTVASLLKPANRDKLVAILTYHVVEGEVRLGTQAPKTVEGNMLSIAPAGLTVNGAKVLASNIEASNGLIHVIDTVLMPPETPKTPEQSVLRIIELAIDRGVPLFNGGNAAACAAVYEVTLDSLVQGYALAIGEADREVIRVALQQVRDRADDHHRNAWTLRHALDRVSASLSKS